MTEPVIACLWRVEDVAEYLRTSTRTVWRRVADGTIPAVRVGSVVRFSPEQVASAVGVLPERERELLDALHTELDAREVEP